MIGGEKTSTDATVSSYLSLDRVQVEHLLVVQLNVPLSATAIGGRGVPPSTIVLRERHLA
jgi:hypothetical protein